MRVVIASHTDVGQIREHNEDYFASDESLGLVVLADGMGGYQAGEVASELAVKTVMAELTTALSKKTADSFNYKLGSKKLKINQRDTNSGYHYTTLLLERAILKANQVIYDAAQSQACYRGMGTTLVAALFHDEYVSIAHVGDSRLYRLRGHEFTQITVDHSVLQELIECGYITREQARHSPNKNLVTRALGTNDTVVVDIQEQVVLADDLYLLCSDGLNDMLEDEVMHTVLTLPVTSSEHAETLKKRAELLVQAANEQGGHDNISVILAQFLPNQPNVKNNWLQQLFKKFWRNSKSVRVSY